LLFVDSVDGAMARLVDLLKDGDVDIQLEAAWCLNNIAGGTDAHAMAVLEAAGDVLISTLSSGNVPLEVNFSVLSSFSAFRMVLFVPLQCSNCYI
jgi:hypothetical protein